MNSGYLNIRADATDQEVDRILEALAGSVWTKGDDAPMSFKLPTSRDDRTALKLRRLHACFPATDVSDLETQIKAALGEADYFVEEGRPFRKPINSYHMARTYVTQAEWADWNAFVPPDDGESRRLPTDLALTALRMTINVIDALHLGICYPTRDLSNVKTLPRSSGKTGTVCKRWLGVPRDGTSYRNRAVRDAVVVNRLHPGLQPDFFINASLFYDMEASAGANGDRLGLSIRVTAPARVDNRVLDKIATLFSDVVDKKVDVKVKYLGEQLLSAAANHLNHHKQNLTVGSPVINPDHFSNERNTSGDHFGTATVFLKASRKPNSDKEPGFQENAFSEDALYMLAPAHVFKHDPSNPAEPFNTVKHPSLAGDNVADTVEAAFFPPNKYVASMAYMPRGQLAELLSQTVDLTARDLCLTRVRSDTVSALQNRNDGNEYIGLQTNTNQPLRGVVDYFQIVEASEDDEFAEVIKSRSSRAAFPVQITSAVPGRHIMKLATGENVVLHDVVELSARSNLKGAEASLRSGESGTLIVDTNHNAFAMLISGTEKSQSSGVKEGFRAPFYAVQISTALEVLAYEFPGWKFSLAGSYAGNALTRN